MVKCPLKEGRWEEGTDSDGSVQKPEESEGLKPPMS